MIKMITQSKKEPYMSMTKLTCTLHHLTKLLLLLTTVLILFIVFYFNLLNHFNPTIILLCYLIVFSYQV